MKHGRIALALVAAVVLVLLYVPAGYGSGMTEHRVAGTEVRVSIPESWFYGDADITEDSEFCRRLSISPEEFKEQYMTNNICMVSFDLETGSYLTLDVRAADTGDYAGMSESEIREEGDKSYAWLEEAGHKVLFQGVVRLNRPYYKIAARDDDVTFYYYVTVQGGKKYIFGFIVDNDKVNGELEEIYDEIAARAEFGEGSGPADSAGPAEDPGTAGGSGSSGSAASGQGASSVNSVAGIIANTITENHGTGKQGSEPEVLRFDQCELTMDKDFRYVKRGDENMDFSEEYVFEHVEHIQAMIYRGTDMAFLQSYPLEYDHAMTDNECMAEILAHTSGGFGHVAVSFTAEALGGNRYRVMCRGDKLDTNVEYVTLFIVHKHGIVEIAANDSVDSDGKREELIAFVTDIANSVVPLEALPQ